MQKAKLNIISIIAWSILTFTCLFYLYSDHPEVETVQNNESTFLQNADSLINKMQQAGVMAGINEHFYTFDERSEWKRDMERA